MGKGTYLGGHVVIGPNTQEWFGNSPDNCTNPEYCRYSAASEKYEALCLKSSEGAGGPAFTKVLKAAKRKLEESARALQAGNRKVVVGARSEQEIAKLRKNVRALAGQIRSVFGILEQERVRLERMLLEAGLDPENYAETGKIDLGTRRDGPDRT